RLGVEENRAAAGAFKLESDGSAAGISVGGFDAPAEGDGSLDRAGVGEHQAVRALRPGAGAGGGFGPAGDGGGADAGAIERVVIEGVGAKAADADVVGLTSIEPDAHLAGGGVGAGVV